MRKTAPLRTLAFLALGCALLAAGVYAALQVGKAVRADKTQATSYGAYNYNALPIDSVVINGEGGVLNVHPYSGGGGDVCCVILPSHWRPGLTVHVKWLSGGHWARDAAGNFVMNGRDKAFVEGTWKERTVAIPPYIGGEGPEMGYLEIYFLPNEEVAALVSRWGAGHPPNPYPYPNDPREP